MVYTVIVHAWTLPGKEAEMKKLLIEASQIFLKDKGTIDWFVMQDAQDPTAWSIVERYEAESDLKAHHENPYFQKFPEVFGPLLDSDKPFQIFSHNEL
ncbi:Antibiotic biosynthesis monooxygenase [Mycena venus]|uniref:Antibiotic biosynthesis monooxygenase n=1 Tax=Mycena venus TaxID=2733690 RepID=A0A8H6WYE9_9AGAR|nr:Antibiotic biosynthesis monooxygenase [Mycena venus]